MAGTPLEWMLKYDSVPDDLCKPCRKQMSCVACLLVPGSLIHSALWQTTCLLIPFDTPPLSQMPSQLDLLEQLLRSGCHLVAGRMSKLDNEQMRHIAQTLKVSSRGNERVRGLAWIEVALELTFIQIEQSAVDSPSSLLCLFIDGSSFHGTLSHHGSARRNGCDLPQLDPWEVWITWTYCANM